MFSFRARFLPVPVLAIASCLASVLVTSPSAYAQKAANPKSAATGTETAPTQSASFDLRYMKPSELVQQLVPFASVDEKPAKFSLPPGLLRVSPDDNLHRVFVQGTPEAVAQVQTLARLLDVEPRTVRVSARILRGSIDPLLMLDDHFTPSESSVITTVTGTGGNNQPMTLHAIGDGQLFRIIVTSHINGDKSITLSASLAEVSALSTAPHPETDKQTRTWTRRITSGTRIITSSVPNRQNKDMAYYLEITPLINTKPIP